MWWITVLLYAAIIFVSVKLVDWRSVVFGALKRPAVEGKDDEAMATAEKDASARRGRHVPGSGGVKSAPPAVPPRPHLSKGESTGNSTLDLSIAAADHAAAAIAEQQQTRVRRDTELAAAKKVAADLHAAEEAARKQKIAKEKAEAERAAAAEAEHKKKADAEAEAAAHAATAAAAAAAIEATREAERLARAMAEKETKRRLTESRKAAEAEKAAAAKKAAAEEAAKKAEAAAAAAAKKAADDAAAAEAAKKAAAAKSHAAASPVPPPPTATDGGDGDDDEVPPPPPPTHHKGNNSRNEIPHVTDDTTAVAPAHAPFARSRSSAILLAKQGSTSNLTPTPPPGPPPIANAPKLQPFGTSPPVPAKPNTVPPSGTTNLSQTVKFGTAPPPGAALKRSPSDVSHEAAKQNKEEEANLTPTELAKRATARGHVCAEVISTEQKYVESLQTLITVFVDPLHLKAEKYGMPPTQLNALFNNIKSIASFHQLLLNDLKKPNASIPGVLIQYSPFMKLYVAYVAGYDKCIAEMSALKKNDKFQNFLKKKRKDPSTHGLDIMSFLIMPIQRIPRYELLLRELIRFTLSTHPERSQLDVALTQIKAIAVKVNESKRRVERMSTILQFQNTIVGLPEPLFQPHRFLIKTGMLKQAAGSTSGGTGSTGASAAAAALAAMSASMGGSAQVEYKTVLFNDLLVWCIVHDDAERGDEFAGWVHLRAGSRVTPTKNDPTAITVSDGKSEFVTLLCGSNEEAKLWLTAVGEALEWREQTKTRSTNAHHNEDDPEIAFLPPAGGRQRGTTAEHGHSRANSTASQTGAASPTNASH